MQVTQTNEFITHAVISGTAQIDMGISNSAEFFQILSSTLYSDQLLAVVRETTCNAWDAHVDSERTDKPIQITVDSTKVVIRDFGHGIHRDLMGPIYGIYGASTKKNDGLQTGGFGLGCKAPFAYTDHFQVISNHEGIKTIYSMSKSSAQVGGKPAIIPIASFPTDETGLEVSINIKPGDMRRFLMLFQLIVRNGEMNAEINGKLASTTPYSKVEHGFMIMNQSPMQEEKNASTVCIRYGNVIYPLENHAELVGYNTITKLLKNLPSGNYYRTTSKTVVLLAPPHSISVTPSREALSMQSHTITTVNKLIADFISYITQENQHLESVLLKESIAKATHAELLNFSTKLQKHSFNFADWQENKLTITDYEMYRRAVRSHHTIYGANKKDMLLRIKAADKLGLLARGKAHSLFRAIQQSSEQNLNSVQSTWVNDHVTTPLLRKMKLNSEMNPARLFFTNHAGCVPVKTATMPKYLCPWELAAKHARPYLVLHYVRKDLDLRITKEGTLTGMDRKEVLFYHVPRVLAKVQSAVDFFTAEGYQVIDLTKPLAGETPESVAPIIKVSSGTRQQGLIALSAAARNGRFNADALYDEDAERTSTVECVFLCTNTDSQRRSNSLDSFDEVSDIILNIYGDVAGVAKTHDQYARYQARGIKDGLTYVAEDVIEYITNSDIILQYFTALRTMQENGFSERIYQYLLKSKVLCDALKLPFITDAEDKTYLTLWAYLSRNYQSLVRNTQKEIDSLPEHQAMLDVCNKIKHSKYFVFLDKGLYLSQERFDLLAPEFLDFINL